MTATRPISAYFDFFINKRHRDDLSRGKGCAMTASGSEIARQGRCLSRSFTDGFDRFARTVETGMGKAPLSSTPRQRALTIAAAAIGAYRGCPSGRKGRSGFVRRHLGRGSTRPRRGWWRVVPVARIRAVLSKTQARVIGRTFGSAP